MSGLERLIHEIHRRSLWQVLGIYVGGSWVALQVVDTMNSTVGLPDWVGSAAFVLLLIGLPIVMATAFVQEGATGAPAAAPPVSEADPGPAPPVGAAAPGARHHLFTWRNAIVGGVLAFALLGVGTAGWLGMRVWGIGPAGTLVAKGVLDERDLVILADFEGPAGDPALAGVVTEALRVDLSQSSAVRLADAGFIAGALARMERPSDAPLDEELAREIGRREGIKAVITGDVARAGAGFALSARVIAPGDGQILVTHRETARDSSTLLSAIDGLSHRLRERIGDPLRALAAAPPLERVTTGDLEALRRFSEGVRLPDADVARAITLLEEAVALDPDFAMAWRALGITLQNYGQQPGRAMEATTKAFQLRDRLTDRERHSITTIYYMSVTSEPRLAIPVFGAMLDADPADRAALTNLGEAHRLLGELETSLVWYDSALAVDSMMSIPLMNVAQVRADLGDYEGAVAAAAQLERRHPGPFGALHRVIAEGAAGRWAAAERELAPALPLVAGSPFLLPLVRAMEGTAAGAQGRLAEGGRKRDEAARLHAERGVPSEALRTRIAGALVMPLVAGTGGGAQAIREATARYPLADMDAIDRPYLELAYALGLLGQPREARAYLEEFESVTPPELVRGRRAERRKALGNIAAAEGRHADALREYRESFAHPRDIQAMALMARAFDASGQADSARAYYERYVDTPKWDRFAWDDYLLGPSIERAAQLNDAAGDLDKAAIYYARLTELWAGADAVLQPRVRAAQRRLEEILRERG